MGTNAPAETIEAAITFSSPFFAAASPRAPPLFGETELSSKSSRDEESPSSRGRTLGARRSRDWGPKDRSQDARERQGNRPGQVQAAWWTSSSEEVPLQFVGGRPGTGLSSGENSSIDQSRKSSTPDQQLADTQHDSTSEAVHLTPPFTLTDDEYAPTDQAISLFNMGTFARPQRKTPSTESSAKSSLVSAASSFAHQLCRRTDMRLFRKRFKPLQHTTKKQRVTKIKATPPLRSPTYGIPKVVEDSRDGDPPDTYDSLQAFIDNSTKVAVTSLKLPPPKYPRTKTSSHTSAERRTDSPAKRTDSPSKIRSISPTLRQPKSSKMKRPGILRSSASLDIAEATKTHQHPQRGGRHKAGATSLSRTSSRDSANDNEQSPQQIPLLRHHSGPSQSPSQRTQHSSSSRGKLTSTTSPHTLDPLPGTPRSWDTGKSETNPFQTDDNYFSTLRTIMSSRKGFNPTLSPAEPVRPFMRRAVEIPQVRENQQRKQHQEIWFGTSSDAAEKRQKRGSIFGVFGLPVSSAKPAAAALASTESTASLQEKIDVRAIFPGKSTVAGSLSPAQPNVSAAVIEPVKVSWRRMSEDITLPLPLTLPPYFARNRRRQGDSDPLQIPGALSTIITGSRASSSKGSDSPAQRRRASISDISDMGQVSPFTPLPPLREDYDRTRRVSIEVPGTPGVHHHPADTPVRSPITSTSKSSKITMVHRSLQSERPSPSQRSLSKRKSSLRPAVPASETPSLAAPTATPLPALAVPAAPRKRSSIFHDIGAELSGVLNPRKSPTRSNSLLKRRRSALTPVARQATHSSLAINTMNNTPIKRTLTHFRKPRRKESLLADRNNIKE